MQSLKEKMLSIVESIFTANQDLFNELLEQITDEELNQVATFRKLLSLYCYQCCYSYFFFDSKLYTEEGREKYVGYARSAEKIVQSGYSSDIDKELSNWLLDKLIMHFISPIISNYMFTKNYGFEFNVEIE